MKRRMPRPLIVALGALATTAIFIAAAGTGSAAKQAAPTNTQPPTVSGTPSEGSTLTASNGQWTGSPTSYDYRWQRCDTTGGSCAGISGAAQRTYVLKAVDNGNTLRVRVTAKNADGENAASSVPTAVVKAAPQPRSHGLPDGYRHDRRRSAHRTRPAADRPTAADPRRRQPLGPVVDRPLPRLGVRRPAGAGRARLRDGGAVQPVLGALRAADGWRRLGAADDAAPAGLPRGTAAAAARDVHPRSQVVGECARRHLHAAPGVVPGQPHRLTGQSGGPPREGLRTFDLTARRIRRAPATVQGIVIPSGKSA